MKKITLLPKASDHSPKSAASKTSPLFSRYRVRLTTQSPSFPKLLNGSFFTRIVVAILCTLIFDIVSSSVVLADSAKRVLLLNSYSYDYKWTREITSAISDFFANDTETEMVVEFMDTKRHHSAEHLANLLRLYRDKYSNTSFAAVITSDDNATNFALEHRQELFPGVPIIFCGVNNIALPERDDFTNITGTVEVPGVYETLELISRLHPDIRKLYVVNEPFTITSRKDRTFLEHQLAMFSNRFQSIWLEGLSDPEMKSTLARLQADSAVLLLSFFPHKEIKTFSVEEGARFISAASPRPVYSMWDYFLGEGIVGGKLTSGTYHGRSAAEMTREVLSGKSPASIPVVSKSANQFMFDYNQLNRFKINLTDLPKASIIINEPSSMLKTHRKQVLVATVAIGLLSCFCGFLLVTVRARKAAEHKLESVNEKLHELLKVREEELYQVRQADKALKESQQATLIANQALQLNIRRLRVLMESIPDLVWLKDINGFYLFCNERFEQLYGATEQEIVGKTDYEFVDKDLANFFRERDKMAMLAGKPMKNEETLTFTNDGHKEIVETIKTPMYDDHGKLIGVLGIARDITERRQIAEELKESELRFRTLHNASFGGIALHDRGVIFDCNQGLTDITGFSKEELLDMNAKMLIAEPFRQSVIDNTRNSYEKPYEVVGLRKNGEEYPLRLDGKDIPYKGRIVRVVEFRDITEQKISEEELRDSEQRHRVIFENSPLSMIRIGENGIILDCNQIFADLMGSSKPAIIGFDALHDTNGQQFRDTVNKALHGQAASCEDYYTSVSGNKTSYLRLQLNPVNIGQSPTEVIGTIDDLSYRKETEDRLRDARDEAQSANRVKSEFLANMSHEIRTPLNGIVGMLHLLLQDPELGASQREYLVMAIKSSNRLTRLLSDILDLSQIEANKLPITENAFSIKEQKNSVLEMFSVVAAEKGLRLEIIIDETLPPILIGDEVRVGQILFNLVSNGIKFTDTGGIYVEVSLLRFRRKNSIQVLFTIRDTGIGFTDNDVQRIFEPFYQVESQYSRRFQGAGLGLSIVRKLVVLLQGSMSIDYMEGEGTCFYVSLPFGLPAGHEEEQPQNTSDKLSPQYDEASTILVVEDDDMSSLIVQKLLERHGYNIVVARNGKEALQRLEEQQIDLILMDVQMPVMDGLATTEAIRSGKVGDQKSSTPIIALTAYTMSGDREKILQSGIDGYLAKPIDGNRLFALVKSMLGNEVCINEKQAI